MRNFIPQRLSPKILERFVWFMNINKNVHFGKKQAIKFHEKNIFCIFLHFMLSFFPVKIIQISIMKIPIHTAQKTISLYCFAASTEQTTRDGSKGRKASDIDFLQEKSLRYVIGMFAIKLSPPTQEHRVKLRGRKCEEFSFSCFH